MAKRLEFSDKVRRELARKAMYVCSNPTCLRVTGFVTTNGEARAIAEGAHIYAASQKGPRSAAPTSKLTKDTLVTLPDKGKTKVKVLDEANGIWLCRNCHGRVDADPEEYPVDLLWKWKQEHEKFISSLVDLNLEQSLEALGTRLQAYGVRRKLLYWLESKRFMSAGLDLEFPRQVLQALDAFRVKLTEYRSVVVEGSEVAKGLQALDDAVFSFFKHLGRADLETMQWDGPGFQEFQEALVQLREDIKTVVVPWAREEGIELERLDIY